ncbi:hypothetical protein [Microcystis sp. LE19-195.1E]|uniref:hypothetical protein n=1 Tax=Microcystis sp. LE19-195.1E TaxID=3016440 RepID=UPI00258C7924|nr:hypothetical protein [Microcystis sp. LE19-195.1E]
MTDDVAAKLLSELRRELPAGHQLFGQEVQAIARRDDRDDVLFRSREESGPVFWVHLTWCVESDPKWPWSEVYESLEDFLDRWPLEELEGDLDVDILAALKVRRFLNLTI